MILVVEENGGIKDVLAIYLEQKNLEYRMVESAAEAISLIDKNCPSYIFVDFFLDETNALSFIGLCREKCPKCKIILYTTLSITKANEIAIKLKIDGILLKPFAFEEFEKLLK